jgi:hypothetical protein
MRLLLFALLATGLGTSAWAAPKTHDGFFLQMNLGFAQQSWSIDNPNLLFSEFTVEGSGAQFDISLGGAVMPNLILFGQLGGTATVDPTFTARAGSNSTSASQEPGEVTAGISTVGGGMLYYTPVGVYVSGAVLSTILQLETDGTRAESDAGLGVQARLGKEWWVSDEWGVGVAAYYFRASVPAAGSAKGKDWTIDSFGLTFSATYN